jgi:hypothetical protein
MASETREAKLYLSAIEEEGLLERYARVTDIPDPESDARDANFWQWIKQPWAGDIVARWNALAPQGPVAELLAWSVRLDDALLHPHQYDAQQGAEITRNFRGAIAEVRALLEGSPDNYYDYEDEDG